MDRTGLDSFKVGDRVRHMDGREGTVINLEFENEPSVVVQFKADPKWTRQDDYCGAYDAVWFKLHPTGLQLVKG